MNLPQLCLGDTCCVSCWGVSCRKRVELCPSPKLFCLLNNRHVKVMTMLMVILCIPSPAPHQIFVAPLQTFIAPLQTFVAPLKTFVIAHHPLNLPCIKLKILQSRRRAAHPDGSGIHGSGWQQSLGCNQPAFCRNCLGSGGNERRGSATDGGLLHIK